MTTQHKKAVEKLLACLVIGNTLLFLILACLHRISTEPQVAVFVDFWGRFTVYSMWFIGFVLYVKFISNTKLLRAVVLTAVCVNIPLFVLLAYFDKISNSQDTLVFVDFWGRITVYSLWVLCYEFYRNYIAVK